MLSCTYIECRFFVSNVVERAFEGAFFDAFQKLGEFLFGCQVIFALAAVQLKCLVSVNAEKTTF